MAEFRMDERFADGTFEALAICAEQGSGALEVDALFGMGPVRGTLLATLLMDTDAAKRRRHGAVVCKSFGRVAMVFADPKAGWDPWKFANEMSQDVGDMMRPVSRDPFETGTDFIFKRVEFPHECKVMDNDECRSAIEEALMKASSPEAPRPGRPAAKV